MNPALASPSPAPAEIARETIRQLVTRRILPTPDNYAKVYNELAGVPASPPAPRDRQEPTLAADRDPVAILRDLLARTLGFAVVPRLGYDAELGAAAKTIAEAIRRARDPAALRAQADELRRFWLTLELRGQTQADVLASALTLLQLLVRNFGELSDDDKWIAPQLEKMQDLLAKPPDLKTMREVEAGMREVIYRQGALKKRVDEAKSAVRDMVAVFVERLSAIESSTGSYSERMGAYAKRIEGVDDIASLTGLVAELMNDTRAIQTDTQRARDEVVTAQKRVHEYELRIETLQNELVQVAGLVREDQLTGVLNRRGLEEAWSSEAARCERRGGVLTLAVLDVDNFKLLNDRLGHQAGDAALAHLARTVRTAMRPSDVVSRYGGEEFVVLMPETGVEEATSVMQRVQRELTRRFFLYNNERVLVTFSAGVAERRGEESRDELIVRADEAMYQAKKNGKNQVVKAP